MSRKSNTDARRAEIVNAMLAVMAANGYEKATIQAIAKQAKLTSGLVHYHFKSKHEILIALVKWLTDFVHSRYLQIAASAKTPEEYLRAYVDARLGLGKGANPAAVAAWVVVGSEAIRLREVRELYQEAVAFELTLIRKLLTDYFKARGKRPRQISQLAAALMAFNEGAFQLASAAHSIMPQRYAADMAMQLIERFVTAEPDC
jgi:TetR/AcrR family transcriptional regulator, transcriptional repressor of bet genes